RFAHMKTPSPASTMTVTTVLDELSVLRPGVPCATGEGGMSLICRKGAIWPRRNLVFRDPRDFLRTSPGPTVRLSCHVPPSPLKAPPSIKYSPERSSPAIVPSQRIESPSVLTEP